ncbi:DUF6461 domain-containing protein [Streptomyces dubilierae]|uniref:DUF6461 domain-containing protein n=1 Tax=Streptomyces dubilierae TaxID=3075533 RepID=A0ABU2PGQ3_9ACTN|nr:DUF6461 domain-containing protein [Streptomyces sp. DSM 41921]MDT0390829.1 DUF6461 domain-containing protein [Streptomyces sp. DSM 41921]
MSGISWLPGVFGQGFSLVFVRDVPARDLLSRFGCSEESVQSLTSSDAQEWELEDDDGGAVLSFGDGGQWSFALQRWGARILEEGVIEQVSAGTELVALISTATAPAFVHALDGEETCGFDPGLPHLRSGTDPDRFLPQMAQAGLPTDGTPVEGEPVAAMLRFAETAFGLSLSQSSLLHEEHLSGRVLEDSVSCECGGVSCQHPGMSM